MAQQTIDIGTVANDGTGDPLRTAFDKTNDNFTEVYTGKMELSTWNGVAFPNPTKLTLYIVTADHGSFGDPDHVPAGAWMIGPPGATVYADFYIKP